VVDWLRDFDHQGSKFPIQRAETFGTQLEQEFAQEEEVVDPFSHKYHEILTHQFLIFFELTLG
jgi:hypothetical protein